MKKILMSLLTIAIVGALITGGVMAYFTDTATSETNTFTAGVLSIDDSLVSQTTAIIIPNMAPGDVTGDYVVTIENNGNINLAWFGDWQFTGGGSSPDLKDALYIDYAKMEFLSPQSNVWLDEAGTVTGYESDGSDIFIQNGTGHGPYASAYTTLAGLSGFSVVTLNNWNNNSLMVPGPPYEHVGALKPGYKYKLTVRFGFAPGAGNQYQTLGPVTAQLQVDATQINAAAIAPYTGLTWLNNQIADQIEP